MQSIKTRLLQQSLEFWHVLTVVLAILIAAQVQYIQHGWINNDSVLYLEAANFFSRGEWQAGFAVFPWPFYALCIFGVHAITTLDTLTSAQVLNVLFFALASHGFMQLIRLSGGKQAALMAGMLLWLSAQYMIGGVLEMLMRDEGFWAFFVLAVAAMIRFLQTQQLKHALLWQTYIIIATLFRVEGLFFLALLPWICFCQPQRQLRYRLRQWFSANSLTLIAVVMIAGVMITHPHVTSKALGRLDEFLNVDLLAKFVAMFSTKSKRMASEVLGSYLDEFAIPGLLLTFLYVIMIKTISTTGWITSLLAWYGLRVHKRFMEPTAALVLKAAAGIALVNAALIIVKVFVLSGRYLMPLAMILMVFASLSLARLITATSSPTRQRWPTAILIGIVMICLLGSIKNLLPKQAGYNYLQDAVAWVQQTAPQSNVFYDDSKVKYYAGQPFTGTWADNQVRLVDAIADQTIQQYQYLVLTPSQQELPALQTILLKLPNYIEINRFKDAKGKKFAVIFKKV